jgi:hypothetical protein
MFSWHYNQFWLYLHSPVAGFSLLVFEVSWSHTTTRQIRYDSRGRVINPSQIPVVDNTPHSQHTNIHAPGGIRKHNLSRRAAVALRLGPHGHWDRLVKCYIQDKNKKWLNNFLFIRQTKNCTFRNTFSHIWLFFTNMFRSLLWPSSGCHGSETPSSLTLNRKSQFIYIKIQNILMRITGVT